MQILNRPAPPPFRESVKFAEQNLYARARELVGDRDPRAARVHRPAPRLRHAQVRSAAVGVPVLLAMAGALLEKSLAGGPGRSGPLNLGGGIDPVYNAVDVAELAVEKGATTVLMPVSARRQLNDLSDDMATKLTVLFYSDAKDALVKSLAD